MTRQTVVSTNRRHFLSQLSVASACATIPFGDTLSFGQGTSTADGSSLVDLSGDPTSVGREFGTINGKDIRRHQSQLLSLWRKRGLTDREMVEKSEPFKRFALKFSPAWLDEIEACASAAEVNADLYAAFLAGKYRELFFVDECTSFLAVGSATRDGATLFHKNRDNTPRAQCFYHKRITHSSNPASFHSTGDTSDMGLMMMVNEHGLAGSADTGGLREDRPKGQGVMNPYILRLIAERAERCEDALEIIQQMIRDGWYAGGSKTGTHWLFADRYGKGLRVAQNSHQERHWFIEDDVAFLVRGNTEGAKLLQQKRGDITFQDMNAAATHCEICFQSSISAMTARIDPNAPAKRSCIWVALPAWSPYIPVLPAASGVPHPLIDGSLFQQGYRLLKSRQTSDSAKQLLFSASLDQKRSTLQRKIYADVASAEKEILAAFDREVPDEARVIAIDSMVRSCNDLQQFLDSSPS